MTTSQTPFNFAIVILNWNGLELLQKFLPKVLLYSKDASFYVIDNASTDDSIKWLKKTYPEVTIISLKKNLGYAGGYNKGLTNIKEPYYCLLNSDIEVSKNWLQPIKKLFINNAKIAVIQPKIKDYYRPELFEYAGAAGGFMDQLGYLYCRGRIFDTLEKDDQQYNDNRKIFWASGACLFIRKEAFWQIEGFDNDYFAHQEEVDLCWRLQHLKHEIYYCGSSEVWHIGGASLNYSDPKKTYLNFRNSLFTLYKNETTLSVIPVLFLRMVLDGIAGLQFLYENQPKNFKAILKAHLDFYKNIPILIKKRKKITPIKIHRPITSIVYNYFIKKRRLFSDLK